MHYTNPYTASKVAEVRKMLAEADQQHAQKGLSPHDIPASVFVRNGLEIEEHQ